MLQHIQLSALAIGVFVGYVVPFLISWLFVAGMLDAAAANDAPLGRRYFWLMLTMNLLGPVMGGFVAARLSKYQPLLNGFLSGLAGGVLVGAFREDLHAGLLFYYALAGVVGGWLCGRIGRAGA